MARPFQALRERADEWPFGGGRHVRAGRAELEGVRLTGAGLRQAVADTSPRM